MNSWLYCLASIEKEEHGVILALDGHEVPATAKNFIKLAKEKNLKNDNWGIKEYLMEKSGRKSGISDGVETEDIVYICERFGDGAALAKVIGCAVVTNKDEKNKEISLEFDLDKCYQLSSNPVKTDLGGRKGTFSNLAPITKESLEKVEKEIASFSNSTNSSTQNIEAIDNQWNIEVAKLLQSDGLVLNSDLPAKLHKKEKGHDFHGSKIDFDAKNRKAKELGFYGELQALLYERKILMDAGREELANQIEHTSEVVGDGTGYDIKSYTLDGNVKYIEVKTTTQSKNAPFKMGDSEIAFSKENSSNYYLYRIYEYDTKLHTGKMYIVQGNVEDYFTCEPCEFNVYR